MNSRKNFKSGRNIEKKTPHNARIILRKGSEKLSIIYVCSIKKFYISKKVENSFLFWDIMKLRNEDRELQVRLAELQADIQIYLTACFGFLAGFLAILLSFEEIYFTLQPERIFMKIYLEIAIPLVGVVCFLIALFFAKKALEARKQMEELRKKYVW